MNVSICVSAVNHQACSPAPTLPLSLPPPLPAHIPLYLLYFYAYLCK